MAEVSPEQAWDDYRQAVIRYQKNPTMDNLAERDRLFAVFEFVFVPPTEGELQ